MAGHIPILDNYGDLNIYLFEKDSLTGLTLDKQEEEIKKIKRDIQSCKYDIIMAKDFHKIKKDGREVCMSLSSEYANFSKENNPEVYLNDNLISVIALSFNPEENKDKRVGSYEVHVALKDIHGDISDLSLIQIYYVA